MTLKLYKVDISPPARAVMMVCDIVNVPVEMFDVDLINLGQMAPEYIEKNPLHSIPVLEDGDLTITDSHAAIIYLIEKYGKDDSFYPKDLTKRTLVNQKLFMNNSVLFPRLKSISRAAIAFGVRKPTQQQLEDLKDSYKLMETFLSKTKYLATDQITLADIAAIATISSCGLVLPLDPKEFPKTDAWIQDMNNQPYCKNVNTPGIEFSKQVLPKLLDF